jgi:hypothetical protein
VEAGAIETGDEGAKSEYAVIRCEFCTWTRVGTKMQAFQDQLRFMEHTVSFHLSTEHDEVEL